MCLDPDWLEETTVDCWWAIAMLVAAVVVLIGIGVGIGWLAWA